MQYHKFIISHACFTVQIYYYNNTCVCDAYTKFSVCICKYAYGIQP